MTNMSESEPPKETKPSEEPDSLLPRDPKPTEGKKKDRDGGGDAKNEGGGDAKTAGEEKDDFFTRITKNDVTAVTNDLKLGLATVDMQDEHGMTPLMHASYRGNKEMCKILMDHGADVKAGSHNNGYTSLHFAGLSGNSSLCQVLLEKGADPTEKNSVARTAAQMAAFVGNHDCVAAINSFVPRRTVENYTNHRRSPALDELCVSSVYNLILQVNFHPVKTALTVKKNAILMTHLENIVAVLEHMAKEEVYKGSSGNEIAAVKIHCLSQTLKFLHLEVTNASKSKDPVDSFIQKLLKCDTPGGIPEGLDRALRESIRTFPYHQTAVLQQLVANLAQVRLCEEPGAWGVIRSVVNGQKGFQDNDPCAACGEERGVKKCSRCHYDAYCDSDCQRAHWFVHKKYCKQKAEAYAKKAAEAEAKASQPPEIDNLTLQQQ